MPAVGRGPDSGGSKMHLGILGQRGLDHRLAQVVDSRERGAVEPGSAEPACDHQQPAARAAPASPSKSGASSSVSTRRSFSAAERVGDARGGARCREPRPRGQPVEQPPRSRCARPPRARAAPTAERTCPRWRWRRRRRPSARGPAGCAARRSGAPRARRPPPRAAEREPVETARGASARESISATRRRWSSASFSTLRS